MLDFDNKNKKKGIARVLAAWSNTYQGLLWMAKNETAFQQELILTLVLTVVSFMLPVTGMQQLILITVLLLILFSETINTAIEAVVDRIGLEHHPLSGLAKDLGSAAVFISFVIATLAWGVVLWSL